LWQSVLSFPQQITKNDQEVMYIAICYSVGE
jgi:hypothetical protein